MFTRPWLSFSKDAPAADMYSALGGIALVDMVEEVESEGGRDDEVASDSVASYWASQIPAQKFSVVAVIPSHRLGSTPSNDCGFRKGRLCILAKSFSPFSCARRCRCMSSSSSSRLSISAFSASSWSHFT